jgi:hypothetical protein
MGQMPSCRKSRQPHLTLLDPLQAAAYLAIRMTYLNAIAVNSTVALWWRASIRAARWRD